MIEGRRIWPRYLRQCFNSLPSSWTRKISLQPAPENCPPSSLLLLCFLSSTLSCPPCIDPCPVPEEQGRGIGDDKGFQIGNSRHWSDILPSLNVKCSYLLIGIILYFWQKRLWWSLRLQGGQLKLIIRYFPGQQPDESSVQWHHLG